MSVFYNIPPPSDQFHNYINDANNAANQFAQYVGATSGITQSNELFNMVRFKNHRNRALKQNFKDRFSGKIYLTDHIFHAVRYNPPNAKIEFFNMQKSPAIIHNSIVILSNNNVMVDNALSKYVELFLASESSIFVIWDFDNHHWLALSGVLAALSDLYVPTHSDNLEGLSRFNNVMAGPVGSGTIQWTKQYILDNNNIVTDTVRTNDPLGTHIEYPQFINRQKTLQILHNTLSSVKLVDGSYHGRDMLDRFKEWCSHKSHWIVPVLNDAPIRIFDSLITGGIPIIPRALKYHKDIVNIWDHVLFYDYEDIHNPIPITEAANRKFDSEGLLGIMNRQSIVMDNYHVDNRVQTILKAVQDEFNIPGLV
jgi:hypothetical protein